MKAKKIIHILDLFFVSPIDNLDLFVEWCGRLLRWHCNPRSIADELVNEKEKYKNIADEMDQAFSELSGF